MCLFQFNCTPIAEEAIATTCVGSVPMVAGSICSPNCSPTGFSDFHYSQKFLLTWWAVEDSNL
jgi:hypothetical protein